MCKSIQLVLIWEHNRGTKEGRLPFINSLLISVILPVSQVITVALLRRRRTKRFTHWLSAQASNNHELRAFKTHLGWGLSAVNVIVSGEAWGAGIREPPGDGNVQPGQEPLVTSTPSAQKGLLRYLSLVLHPEETTRRRRRRRR